MAARSRIKQARMGIADFHASIGHEAGFSIITHEDSDAVQTAREQIYVENDCLWRYDHEPRGF